MNQQLLATLRPTTLAKMAADLSQYLAKESDGGPDDLSSYQWDKLKFELDSIVDALRIIVKEDTLMLLEKAGADPEIIFEGM